MMASNYDHEDTYRKRHAIKGYNAEVTYAMSNTLTLKSLGPSVVFLLSF